MMELNVNSTEIIKQTGIAIIYGLKYNTFQENQIKRFILFFY